MTIIGFINLVKRGTSQHIKRDWILFYAHLEQHWKGRYGMTDCVAVKGILPYVGCVGIVETKLDRYCRGIHSFVVEMTSLAILPFHCLSSLINPIVDWLGWTFIVFGYVWACSSPFPCGNHAHIGGGSYVERLMSTTGLWLGGTLQRHS